MLGIDAASGTSCCGGPVDHGIGSIQQRHDALPTRGAKRLPHRHIIYGCRADRLVLRGNRDVPRGKGIGLRQRERDSAPSVARTCDTPSDPSAAMRATVRLSMLPARSLIAITSLPAKTLRNQKFRL